MYRTAKTHHTATFPFSPRAYPHALDAAREQGSLRAHRPLCPRESLALLTLKGIPLSFPSITSEAPGIMSRVLQVLGNSKLEEEGSWR